MRLQFIYLQKSLQSKKLLQEQAEIIRKAVADAILKHRLII